MPSREADAEIVPARVRLPHSIGGLHSDHARGGDRHYERGEDGDGGKTTETSGQRPIAGAIEECEHARLELARLCHPHGEYRHGRSSKRVRQLEKMTGVVVGIGTRRQNEIVAGQLPLDAQAARQPPRAWMHPIERTRQRRRRLRETVATGDVREFVQQNGATHLEGPGIGR